MRLSAEAFQPEIPYDRKQRRRSSSKTLPPAQLSSSCARLWAALRRSPFVEHETLKQSFISCHVPTYAPSSHYSKLILCLAQSGAHTGARESARQGAVTLICHQS